MGLFLSGVGEEIGIVLSNATSSIAPVALRRDKELAVHEEDLVLIEDSNIGKGYYMLGVVRWLTRYEPFLRRSTHNVYIEHPEALTSEVVMPFSNAFIEIYGAICDGARVCNSRGFVSNVYPPTPGSKVYRVTRAEQLSSYLTVSSPPISVGVHKYSGWRLPLDPSWLNYHVGVFGATGTGKSRLIVKLLSEIVKTGYSVIVFDHNGVDYVPFAETLGGEVIDASTIRIEPRIFSSIVARLVDVQGVQRDVIEVAALCYAMNVYREKEDRYNKYVLNECNNFVATPRRPTLGAKQQDEESITPKDRFLRVLERAIRFLYTRGGDAAAVKLKLLTRLNVPDHVFDKLYERVLEPEDVVDKALRNRLVVIDMSTEQDIEVKRGIIASVAEAVWQRIAMSREEIRLGIVVDEAQNYACEYCGESSKALETIAREGRKWKYFLVVASQRVSRDIKPGIRSNLGTVFFSRLQATGDLQELSGYLDLGRVSEANLAMLGRKEFYVAGLMNPLRRPMLLVIDDVGAKAPSH